MAAFSPPHLTIAEGWSATSEAAYFTDDEYYEKLDKELTWLANMRDEGVRRIAARTVGLSPEAQQDIVEKVDELRRREHLAD